MMPPPISSTSRGFSEESGWEQPMTLRHRSASSSFFIYQPSRFRAWPAAPGARGVTNPAGSVALGWFVFLGWRPCILVAGACAAPRSGASAPCMRWLFATVGGQ